MGAPRGRRPGRGAQAATLGTVNARADSFPTLGRLFADDPEHVVDTPQLQQMRSAGSQERPPAVQGVVIPETIPSTVSHFDTRPAYVYLPPAWFAKVTPNLPTLVLLPGEPGSASDWSEDGDADGTADAFAAAHHGVAPIIVMPDPDGVNTVDSECVNSQFGKAETYLVKDVPAFAREHFNASTAPGSLAIAGLSAGGTCSVMLALHQSGGVPDVRHLLRVRVTPVPGGPREAETIRILFGGSRDAFDAHDPSQLLETNHYCGMAGWFEVGRHGHRTVQGGPRPHSPPPSRRASPPASGPTRRPRLRPVDPGLEGRLPLALVAARPQPAAGHRAGSVPVTVIRPVGSPALRPCADRGDRQAAP